MNIEFISPTLPSRRAWWLALGLAVSAAVLFGAGQALQARAVERSYSAHARQPPATSASSPSSAPPAYVADLRQAIDRATLPEAAVLRELETVAVPGIHVVSIDLDMADHRATVELQAETDQALEDYLDQLNAGGASPAWHIDHLADVSNATFQVFAARKTNDSGTQAVALTRGF